MTIHTLVCRSKCRQYIGIHGIVIQETQNTFKLICKDDRLRSKQAACLTCYDMLHLAIAKANSIFSFTVGKMLFNIRGSHIKYRPGDRSARKFKEKSLTIKDLQY